VGGLGGVRVVLSPWASSCSKHPSCLVWDTLYDPPYVTPRGVQDPEGGSYKGGGKRGNNFEATGCFVSSFGGWCQGAVGPYRAQEIFVYVSMGEECGCAWRNF